MPDASYVTVTLMPFYRGTKHVAGETKKYLVEVHKNLIEKAGASATATALAINPALSTCDAEFGFTRPDIEREIHCEVTKLPPNLPEAPYKFEDCRVWPIPLEKAPVG